MIEMTFHGRGGQGVVTASKLFAEALFRKGEFVQSMTAYGGDRRGAPVAAYLRVDKGRIHLRSKIRQADVVVVFDESLLDRIDTAREVRPGGKLIVSTASDPKEISRSRSFETWVVDGPAIALRHDLGARELPYVNTIMLAALARATGLVKLEELNRVVSENPRFKGERDLVAIEEAWREVHA